MIKRFTEHAPLCTCTACLEVARSRWQAIERSALRARMRLAVEEARAQREREEYEASERATVRP